MDFFVNLAGFANSIWILYMKKNRDFFCVCDKVTIGDYTPQCVFGAFAHLVAMAMVLSGFGGYAFYLLSLWLFGLVYSGVYTYKRIREICKGCFIAFTMATLSTSISITHLPYFPWIVSLTYLFLMVLSLCLTSLSLKKIS